MEENITEKDMELWFRQYLNDTFGEGFNTFITPPEDAKCGERLIYKYKSGSTAIRHESTQQDLDDFDKVLAQMAQACKGTYIPTKPPVTSGLPFPRLIDLNKGFIWESDMEKYHLNEDLLPSKDFDLEWALGVFFASDKTLYHLDFTHPKVKGIFSFEYDREYTMPKCEAARRRFTEFMLLLETYKRLGDELDHFKWVKITQVNSKITITIN
jgi:hypothetical protein